MIKPGQFQNSPSSATEKEPWEIEYEQQQYVRDFYDRLSSNFYKTKLPYPYRPIHTDFPRSLILEKKAADLTAEEFAQIPEIKAEHEAIRAKYRADMETYNQDQRRLEELFYKDMYAYHDILDPDEPIVAAVRSQADAEGHSEGLYGISSRFSDLVDTILSVVREHYQLKETKKAAEPEAPQPKQSRGINPPKRFPPPD